MFKSELMTLIFTNVVDAMRRNQESDMLLTRTDLIFSMLNPEFFVLLHVSYHFRPEI